MTVRTLLIRLAKLLILGLSLIPRTGSFGQLPHEQTTQVPRMWDDESMSKLEVPLANPVGSPRQVPASYYYRIPVRPIYKMYPVYAPGREPAGYMEWLKHQEPVLLWNDAGRKPKLQTETDWIQAGEMVFSAPVFSSAGDAGVVALADVRTPEWYEKSGMPISRDGTLPYLHYVIREKGKVELGSFSCAMCHSRVMPDGSVIKGAQGNFPFERAEKFSPRPQPPLPWLHAFNHALYSVPWLNPDPIAWVDDLSADQITDLLQSIPPGVVSRHRSNPLNPVQVPDLIGVKDRRYLDRTGLQPQHSLVDLMRYAALNQGADALASFPGAEKLSSFVGPIFVDIPGFGKLPDPSDPILVNGRYSDEQLYALALYIYSLKPPPNPHRFDTVAARGQNIFQRQGCPTCHTPPLYTNNKLTPADGFKVPDDHWAKYDILPLSVGTDSGLTLKTRRGTGYYKVPSLKGVWYRGMFGHSGWCATLDDWFDPARLNDDYIPTGFKPYGSKTYAVKGHPFGLNLSPQEKKDLIAFLKTL